MSATVTKLATSVLNDDDLWFGEIPPDTMEVIKRLEIERFLVLVKQVNIRLKSAGGIILPDQAKEDQQWTHGLVQIVKLGRGAYCGRRYEDIGYSPDDKPEPGDIAVINAKVPQRIKIDGVLFFTIPDDGLIMRVARSDLQRISFTVE